MITFDCPHCGQTLRVDDAYAGRQGTCKHCKNPVTAPFPLPSNHDLAAATPRAPVHVLPSGSSGPSKKRARRNDLAVAVAITLFVFGILGANVAPNGTPAANADITPAPAPIAPATAATRSEPTVSPAPTLTSSLIISNADRLTPREAQLKQDIIAAIGPGKLRGFLPGNSVAGIDIAFNATAEYPALLDMQRILQVVQRYDGPHTGVMFAGIGIKHLSNTTAKEIWTIKASFTPEAIAQINFSEFRTARQTLNLYASAKPGTIKRFSYE